MTEFEQKLVELQVKLAELEIAKLTEPKHKDDAIWTNPVLLAIVGATATAIVGLVTSSAQIEGNRQLEREKLQSSLILKATESSDPKQRIAGLKFLVKAGLVTDAEKKIESLTESDVPQIQSRFGDTPSAVLLQNLALDVFSFYERMIDTRKKASTQSVAYEPFNEDWRRISAQLRAFSLREASSPTNSESARIAQTILEFWEKYRQQHQESRDYAPALMALHRDRFQRLFTAALVAEEAKRLERKDSDPRLAD